MNKKLLTLSLTTAILLFAGCTQDNTSSQNEQKVTAQSSEQTNKSPIANINADKTTITEGEKISFNGKGSSDSDGEIISHEWIDKDGKIISTDKTFTQTYTKPGTYTKTLKVTDDKGKSSTKEITITVIKKQDKTIPNKPPIAKAQISETEIFTEQGVRFTSNGSKDLDGKIISYEWRDKEGILLSTKAEFSRGFPYPATYTKILTVTDDKGATATDSVTLIVKDKPKPPTADAGKDITITEGESITVDASNSKTENKTITMYRWDIKNKIYCENSKTCKIENLTAGEYIVTLTIMDSEKQMDADTLKIIVKKRAEVVNGYVLPPEPDEKLNNSTLLGIDSNDNGVRDDVERYIVKKYKDHHKIVTEIGFQMAKAYSTVLELGSAGNRDDSYLFDAQDCNFYFETRAQYFGDPILVDHLIDFKDMQLNTKSRVRAYLEYDKQFSGGVYRLTKAHKMKEKCNFDVDTLLGGK